MTHSVFSVLLMAACLAAPSAGCAQAQDPPVRADNRDPSFVPYVPMPMPATASFKEVRDDLAALLRERKRPVGVRFGRRGPAQPDFNRLENAHQLIELIKGGGTGDNIVRLQYDKQKQFEYILLKAVAVVDERIELGPGFAFPFRDVLEGPITVTRLKDGAYPFVIQLQNQLSFRFDAKDLGDAKRMADDLEFLRRHYAGLEEGRAAQSETLAAQYRALKTKPPVSEAQRRFIVQANAYNQMKNYEQALEHYQKALDLEPLSYPAAYFNMALLSAQLGRYRAAMAYMKQYLLLEPEAKDARSGQDKIYEWEIMAGSSR
ncbi:hypothetical protein METEAL_18570 [Mesoterricola silvestris]|uniref:Tetratricopeptide repeat protein n=2 Tax=Mesoterricola silvestris TaxID=2927979 RepID=A0AA48KBN0_9BACT|nr:hypothetical protein METEAL_18570 [Mesoterricola silvestris]